MYIITMEIASKFSININLLSFSVKCLDLHVKKVLVYFNVNRTHSTYIFMSCRGSTCLCHFDLNKINITTLY